jgi:hypothetical protein
MKMEHGSASVLVAPRTPAQAVDEPVERPSHHVNENGVARFTPAIYSALSLLLDASSCAADVGADVWQFSVEINALLRAGLTTSACRWLIAKGLAKHACETTTNNGDRRVFQPCTNLAIPKRACFVITDRGIACANELLRSGAKRQAGEQRVSAATLPTVTVPTVSVPTGRPASDNGEPQPTTPTWDSDRQQLRVGRIIVKEFKVPAANQEAILAAFQEEGWVPRIDDPLTPKLNQDSKRRLHDTINSLNRNQKHSLLRFLGDGKGEGVRWEFSRRQTSERAIEAFAARP